MKKLKYLLNQGFVEKNMAKASGAMFFGHPVEELSRDELMAMAMFFAEQHLIVKKEALDSNIRGIRGIGR